MAKRTNRVSEAQWGILLDFMERNPNLARTRNYNNSARGRAESLRLWEEVAALLNAEGSGTTKTAKDWSIYVSNYKSKLKKIVADINADATGTGGGPPRGGSLSDTESRFLAIMGEGFGQTAPHVRVNPFPIEDQEQPLISGNAAVIQPTESIDINIMQVEENIELGVDDSVVEDTEAEASTSHTVTDAAAPPLPRRTRHTRYRSRPLAPLDEARRILSQVEMQRAAADAAKARALSLIGAKLDSIAEAIHLFAASHSRIADAIQKYVTDNSKK